MSQELLLSALAAPLLSAVVAFVIARAQIRLKIRELENFYLEVGARMEGHRQEQHQEVLRARIQAYPILWQGIVTHTINWPYQRRGRDARWAMEFAEAVDRWNAEYGVFLSEASYKKFREFRAILAGIARGTADGQTVGIERYREIYRAFSGDRKLGSPGLATQLKWDLGSYGEALIRRPGLRLPGNLGHRARRRSDE